MIPGHGGEAESGFGSESEAGADPSVLVQILKFHLARLVIGSNKAKDGLHTGGRLVDTDARQHLQLNIHAQLINPLHHSSLITPHSSPTLELVSTFTSLLMFLFFKTLLISANNKSPFLVPDQVIACTPPQLIIHQTSSLLKHYHSLFIRHILLTFSENKTRGIFYM